MECKKCDLKELSPLRIELIKSKEQMENKIDYLISTYPRIRHELTELNIRIEKYIENQEKYQRELIERGVKWGQKKKKDFY